MGKSKNTFLKIADFIIRIKQAEDIMLVLEGGYEPFLFPETNQTEDILVEAFPGFPDDFSLNTVPLYTAKESKGKLWEISMHNGHYQFLIFDQERPEVIQQVAYADVNFKHWKVYMEPLKGENGQLGLCPFLYPLGPLIMYYLTVNQDAIMVHGSGVADENGDGRIFSGFSGVGKSTMAKLWAGEGATIVNDDRLIIRKIENEFFVYNTPMYYADKPKQVKLKTIYLPRHDRHNNTERLLGSNALSGLMAYCIQHGYNKTYIEGHLDFLADLCSNLPVFRLGFVPDKSVVAFIKQNEISAVSV
jgi:hypothetical protein